METKPIPSKGENSNSYSELNHKYLTFWIDNQLYGISVYNVIQIVSFGKITQVPNFPEYAKGIINIRGVIVPIIDIRIRFNKQERSENQKSCIIITSINVDFAGFLVDSLNEVTGIERKYITQLPKLSNNTCTYLNGIAKTEDQIIMLLDLEKLLNNQILNLVE